MSSDTIITTAIGPQPITDLINKRCFLQVNGRDCPTTWFGFWSLGEKTLYRVTLTGGLSSRSVKLPATTKLLCRSSRTMEESTFWCPVSELRQGDLVVLDDPTPGITDNSSHLNLKAVATIMSVEEYGPEPTYICSLPLYVANGILIRTD